MTDQPVPDVTSQILIQIRDEMRAMRASFEARMEAVETRMTSLEQRMKVSEDLVLRVSEKIDGLQIQVDFLGGKIDAFEARLDSFEDKNEVHHQELFRRFGIMDADLKRFAGIVNDAILHYADEMDSVRDRVLSIESTLDIAPASD